MKQQDSASGAIVIRKFQKPHNAAEWLELVMNAIFFLCGILAIGCVALITVYMVISGLPAIGQIGIGEFLLGQEWASTAAEPKFGILPFILSSVYGTLGAIIIGIPIGLLTAVFLSKAAAPKLRTAATSAIELLSGIPSVIFGLLGMQLLVPAVAAVFGRASGACLLATDAETWFKVSVPAAKSGIAAGIVLGIGRAVGEAMAVMMVAGNSPNMPGIFKSVTFLTTAIAKEMSYASGLQRQALFSIGLVLFAFIMLINLVLNFFLKGGSNGEK